MSVVIPPFTNVPAPNDGVTSAWAQQLTQYAVDHVTDPTDAHDASAISFVPTGAIAATDVQAAIAEVAAEASSAVVTGTILMFAAAAAPSGYLMCDGAAHVRATYPTLFAQIGTTYGAGDGATTFNMPDLRGRFPVGRNASDTAFDTLGEKAGSKDASLPAHSHTVNAHAHTVPAHAHTNDHDHPNVVTDSQGAHSHNLWAGMLGTSTAGTTDYKWSNTGTYDMSTGHTGNIDVQGAHQHNVDIPNYTGNTGTAAAALTSSEFPGTNSQGVSATNANLPPYIAINFIIKT